MRYFILLMWFTLFIASSCSSVPIYKMSEKQKIANRIRTNVAIRLRNETGLVPIGTGGRMMDEVKMLGISFKYYKPIGIDEARELLVEATDALVKEVNNTESIRQYLYTTPFSSQNVEIRIFLTKADGYQVDLGSICVVSMIQGTLDYDIRDPETGGLKTMHSESYEDAVRILEEQHNTSLPSSF